MTTLTLAEQDGSHTQEWIQVDSEFHTPAVASWNGEIGFEMVDGPAYGVDEFLLANEDVSAAIGIQAEFGPLAAEREQQTTHLTSPTILAELAAHGLFLASEDVSAAEGTRDEFERLAAEWKQETAHLSSPSTIAEHRAYQEIIGMGKEAIPLILQDLEESQAQWFWALRSIARESPVRPVDRGDVDAMTAAWMCWGKSRRYI